MRALEKDKPQAEDHCSRPVVRNFRRRLMTVSPIVFDKLKMKRRNLTTLVVNN